MATITVNSSTSRYPYTPSFTLSDLGLRQSIITEATTSKTPDQISSIAGMWAARSTVKPRQVINVMNDNNISIGDIMHAASVSLTAVEDYLWSDSFWSVHAQSITSVDGPLMSVGSSIVTLVPSLLISVRSPRMNYDTALVFPPAAPYASKTYTVSCDLKDGDGSIITTVTDTVNKSFVPAVIDARGVYNISGNLPDPPVWPDAGQSRAYRWVMPGPTDNGYPWTWRTSTSSVLYPKRSGSQESELGGGGLIPSFTFSVYSNDGTQLLLGPMTSVPGTTYVPPAPPVPSIKYTESVNYPTQVQLGASFNFTITGGEPGSKVSWVVDKPIINPGDRLGVANITYGSFVLGKTGGRSETDQLFTDSLSNLRLPSLGKYTFTFTFSTGNRTTTIIDVVPPTTLQNVITGFNIVNGGSGYLCQENISVYANGELAGDVHASKGSLTHIEITDPGLGLKPGTYPFNGQSPAGTLTVGSNGQVTGFNITDPGPVMARNGEYPITANLPSDGTQVPGGTNYGRFTGLCTGPIESGIIQWSRSHSNTPTSYSSPPTITLGTNRANGSGAVITAILGNLNLGSEASGFISVTATGGSTTSGNTTSGNTTSGDTSSNTTSNTSTTTSNTHLYEATLGAFTVNDDGTGNVTVASGNINMRFSYIAGRNDLQQTAIASAYNFVNTATNQMFLSNLGAVIVSSIANLQATLSSTSSNANAQLTSISSQLTKMNNIY